MCLRDLWNFHTFFSTSLAAWIFIFLFSIRQSSREKRKTTNKIILLFEQDVRFMLQFFNIMESNVTSLEGKQLFARLSLAHINFLNLVVIFPSDTCAKYFCALSFFGILNWNESSELDLKLYECTKLLQMLLIAINKIIFLNFSDFKMTSWVKIKETIKLGVFSTLKQNSNVFETQHINFVYCHKQIGFGYQTKSY